MSERFHLRDVNNIRHTSSYESNDDSVNCKIIIVYYAMKNCQTGLILIITALSLHKP